MDCHESQPMMLNSMIAKDLCLCMMFVTFSSHRAAGDQACLPRLSIWGKVESIFIVQKIHCGLGASILFANRLISLLWALAYLPVCLCPSAFALARAWLSWLAWPWAYRLLPMFRLLLPYQWPWMSLFPWLWALACRWPSGLACRAIHVQRAA